MCRENVPNFQIFFIFYVPTALPLVVRCADGGRPLELFCRVYHPFPQNDYRSQGRVTLSIHHVFR